MKEQTKITVLYNVVTASPTGNPTALLTEEGAQDDARIIAQNLIQVGLAADIFELTEKKVAGLSSLDTNLFFNLCDGVGNNLDEARVPRILDELKLPYTGANSLGLRLTTDKETTKEFFQRQKIPTPKFFLSRKPHKKLPKGFSFPLILKPVGQDCSLGISLESVVFGLSQLQKEAQKLLSTFAQPVLVEEYIDGRELNVAILGSQVLPVSEITFGSFFKDKPKIVDFAAKWEENSPNYRDTVGVCPAELPVELAQKIQQMALGAYRALGGRDYGRVDLRLDRKNRPYFLEVNLNPDISPEAGFFRSAKAAGLTYQDLITDIVKSACQRYGLVVK